MLILGLAYFTFLFLKNAWVSDDAFITFRTIEQFFSGHGLRWNPHERVQAFTHPLWFWLLAFLRLFSRNDYLNALAASYLLCVGALLLLRASCPAPGAGRFVCCC